MKRMEVFFINRLSAYLSIATVLVLLCACNTAPTRAPYSVTPPPYSISAAPGLPPTPTSESEPEPESESEPEFEPTGSGRYIDDEDEISSEIEDLVLRYMNLYYDSLAKLKLPPQEKLEMLFTEAHPEQALGNYTVWEYLIETRKLQNTDLSMTAYSYTMTTRRQEAQPDGSLRLMVMESSVQNFTAHPEIDSECIRVYHSFTFTKEDGQWKIRDHMQLDSLYFTLFGTTDESNLMNAFEEPSFPKKNIEEFLENRLEELMTQAIANMERRTASEELSEATVDQPYDRQAAVSYSHRYADERNPDWPDYGAMGGNCQNYLSQCLLAGGIPMDSVGDAVWKWYSDIPNNRAGKSGRSAAWSSVTPFREYVEANSGYGLVGQVDAPYYSGERGDILQLGPEGLWRHTVIITTLIYDSEGNTVDYLINSNTADLRDYPAGAYSYTNQSLIKILGWNES